jgi:hypothetical protein
MRANPADEKKHADPFLLKIHRLLRPRGEASEITLVNFGSLH